MAARIGQFFLFLGLIVLVVFFGTDQVRQPVYGLFCIGSVLFGFGILLIWRNRQPPPPSERFRLFRKSREENDENR